MKKNWRVLLLIGLLFGGVIWGGNWFYQSSKLDLERSILIMHQKEIESDIQGLITDKKDSAMAIAIALSENAHIKRFLCKTCEPIDLDFSELVAELNEYTDFKNIWVQVIDAEGKSQLRSWSIKKGDTLLRARSDLRGLLENPQISHSLNVGKFTLSFKSTVPIFDEYDELLGFIEIISPFGTLAHRLKHNAGVDSAILIDKGYFKQLTAADPKQLIGEFYIANDTITPEARAFLTQLGDDKISKFNGYQMFGDTIVERHLIQDPAGQVLAYWFTFSKKSSVNFSDMARVLNDYLYGFAIVVLLSILLLTLYFFKRQSDFRQRYYRQIIDSASEIIFVSNRQHIVDVNRHFFEFYNDFKNLDEFLAKYHCVCETFEIADGFLQEDMNGVYWLDYVMAHHNKLHKAKILKHGKPHYFTVKARLMEGLSEPLFNVLLQDITDQELYKNQLEHQSQTDALTGVGNRLYFNRTLNNEIQRSHRYANNLSLLMFDIDHFKKVNDTYGHEVGDQVLIEIARVIQSHLRETDVFCRFGGEEFVIIMPETALEEAQCSANRLRLAIEGLSSNELPKQVTISFGVGKMTKWDSEKTLLKRVDDALYRAKELGRNRVELAKEDE